MANDSRGRRIARDVMAMITKMIDRDAVCYDKYRGAEALPVRQSGILIAHETVKRQSSLSEPEFGLVGKSTCQ
eukprot:10424618-Heterocapsa_arctica.AAC.1